MLASIYIKDFVLISELHCPLPDSLIAVTGETGAGKSIFVAALQLLAGGRADLTTIRRGCQRAVVEGEFAALSDETIEWLRSEELLSAEEAAAPRQLVCIVRRELNASGRSRIFINDTPATLTQLEQLGRLLIDVHSQHRNLLLRDAHYQTSLVDSQIPADLPIVARYREAYSHYKAGALRLKKLREEARTAQAEEETNRHYLDEIKSLSLHGMTPEQLEAEAQRLTHAQDIEEGLESILEALSGSHSVVERLAQAIRHLERTEPYMPTLSPYAERLRTASIEIDDIEDDLRHQLGDLQSDPARLEEINATLARLNALLKRHNLVSYDELQELARELQETLSRTAHYEAQLADLREEVLRQRQAVLSIAVELRTARTAAARRIADEVTRSLRQLEMPHARFVVEITPTDKPTEQGMDSVLFLLSANSDQPLRPVADIASGGEIARLMLSLKALRTSHRQPTIVLDEIDSGTSGIAASRIGEMLHEMGGYRQCIVITHLPQIAAAAPHHILIYKQGDSDATLSHLRHLTPDERVDEIARLQSGDSITPEATAAARQLLSIHL